MQVMKRVKNLTDDVFLKHHASWYRMHQVTQVHCGLLTTVWLIHACNLADTDTNICLTHIQENIKLTAWTQTITFHEKQKYQVWLGMWMQIVTHATIVRQAWLLLLILSEGHLLLIAVLLSFPWQSGLTISWTDDPGCAQLKHSPLQLVQQPFLFSNAWLAQGPETCHVWTVLYMSIICGNLQSNFCGDGAIEITVTA